MQRLTFFILFILLVCPSFAFEDPYFINLEKKINHQPIGWFPKILRKRLQLNLEKKIKTTVRWNIELEQLLTLLRERKKITSEEYHSLSVENFKECLSKDDEGETQKCIEDHLIKYRDTHGLSLFEERVFALKNEFFKIIKKNSSAAQLALSVLTNTCIYSEDIDCLNQLAPYFTKEASDQTDDDLLQLSMIETARGNKQQADSYFDKLLKTATNSVNSQKFLLLISYLYLFRDQCQKGLDTLSKIPKTNDSISVKEQLNALLTHAELSRLCGKNFPSITDLKRLLVTINKKDLYLRLKALSELTLQYEKSSDTAFFQELRLELSDVEKQMFSESGSARLQLTKILLLSPKEKKAIDLVNLRKLAEFKKNSENQYVLRALPTK